MRVPPATGAYAPPPSRLGREALRARLPAGGRLTPEALLAQHPARFSQPRAVTLDALENHQKVSDGPFALSAPERQRLASQGFVLATREGFPNFLTGYFRLYQADHPVYVSADAVLNALHLGFDNLLAELEEDALAAMLRRSLAGLRRNLQRDSSLAPETRQDVDAFLAVPLSLLEGSLQAPVAGASEAAVRLLVGRAQTAEGAASVELYGAAREVDFSQMTPRGHYTANAARQRYFRAVMWLGREGLRLVDVADGRRVLRPRQVRLALALHALADADTRQGFETVEDLLGALVGEPEALTFRDLDQLSRRVQPGMSDEAVLALLDALRGERPRVATSILVHPDWLEGPLPQPVAFSLVPQRYTPDARVLSNVSYDRVPVLRMMPDALDAAFGALGNDQALTLLAPELGRFDYATELETQRALVDAHEAAYWDGSLYARWLTALRVLSPRETSAGGGVLSPAMTTEAWGTRLLATQLAAWSELRHDTVLYVAQSYSAVPGCSYPAAWVDPYPAHWEALQRWSARAGEVIARAPWTTAARRQRWARWATGAEAATRQLGAIAARERTGQDLTAEQLAWVNQAIVVHEENVVCATVTNVVGGWYYELFEPRLELGDRRAMVADVHTQPADENGTPVGRVLHVGTGDPRLLVVVAGPEGHQGVYFGLASTYLERTTQNFQRLTDERWREELGQARSPSWLAPALAP